MKFKELSKYLEKLEKTSSRIEITKTLSDLFKKSDSPEIDKIVYLLLGRLAPKYDSVVFNLAERMMIQVIAKAYKKDPSKVKEIYKEKGDLGITAEILAKTKGSGLSVTDVYTKLHEIAVDEGPGSQQRKIDETAKLLSRLDPLSARFVSRIPVGKLRLGFSDKTIIDALSWMRRGDKSARQELERAYAVTPDVGDLAKKVKKEGIKKGLGGSVVQIGVPILPMLGQRLKDPKEMLQKMGGVSIEPKLDGLRLSVHLKKGKNGFVKAFTRNLNENAWMFPELKKLEKYVNVKEVILDTEAVGVDSKRQKMVHFQATMTRRRKHEIERTAKEIEVKFFVFDLLYKDGENLMDKTYIERRKELEKTVKDGRLIQKVEYRITNNPKEISELFNKYQKQGFEGIFAKKSDAKYVPGRTGWRWVKMKEVEGKHAKLADTIDAIVMGYTRGKGKRAQFGVGQFLAGIRDRGKIKTFTKVGTGITDEKLKELKQRLGKIQVKEKPKEYIVHKDLEPDYWVKPSLVVELAADEITKSPKHTSGYALRFPRLIKFRDDKGSGQATGLGEVKNLLTLQN